MDQTEYIGYIGLAITLIFFIIIVVNYFKYWRQLKRAFIQSGIEWPFYSQEKINEDAQKDFVSTYGMISTNIGRAARIVFTMRTDNPLIMKPLLGIRRVLIVFFLFPFLLAFILVVVSAFLET